MQRYSHPSSSHLGTPPSITARAILAWRGMGFGEAHRILGGTVSERSFAVSSLAEKKKKKNQARMFRPVLHQPPGPVGFSRASHSLRPGWPISSAPQKAIASAAPKLYNRDPRARAKWRCEGSFSCSLFIPAFGCASITRPERRPNLDWRPSLRALPLTFPLPCLADPRGRDGGQCKAGGSACRLQQSQSRVWN